MTGTKQALRAACGFEAVLMPHRSLSRRGFKLLMAALAVGLSAVGFAFWSLGAWPVAGFCGLEVLLVWGAFELNYRSARRFERIVLDDDALTVERIGLGGEVMRWRFEPGWVRVVVVRPEEQDSRLLLTSHGRTIAVGSFLSRRERIELADSLRFAIERWRTAPAAP